MVKATKTRNVEKAGKPVQILVVEDNPEELRLIQRMLEKAKDTLFHINPADRLSTGVKLLAGGNMAVVLLDLSLPDSQGLDTLVRMRSQAPDVPIVVLSDLDDKSLATAVIDGGAQDYLIKGQLNGNLLIHSLHHAIQRKRLEQALRESEEKLKTYLESAPDGVYITDLNGAFLYGNSKSERITGYAREELLGGGFLELDLLPEKYLATAGELLAFSVLKRPTGPDELELRRKDGDLIWVEINTAPIEDDGKPVVLGFVRDITERKNTERALVLAAEEDSAIAELASKLVSPASSIEDISSLVLDTAERFTNSALGFVGYMDLETGHMVSPVMTRGIRKSCQLKDKTTHLDEFGGLWGWVFNNRQSLLTNTPADDPRSTGTPPGHISIRNFLSAPALIGEELAGLVALANSSRSYNKQDLAFIERLAALYAIALQRKRLEDTVSQLAYHDPLTGLPNRTLFNDRLTLALARANRYRQNMALMVLDIDRFKDINDTIGHEAGDSILIDLAGRLVSILRKTDTVTRMGGDEFMLLLPEVTETEHVANIARKLLEATRKPFMFHDREVRITTSIGIAIYPEDGEDVGMLIKHADLAMYQAKEMGRDNCLRYAPSMSPPISG